MPAAYAELQQRLRQVATLTSVASLLGWMLSRTVKSEAGRATVQNLNARTRAWWFNPRDGSAALMGEMPGREDERFVPPTPGEALDWVLVLDDASADFPPPGRGKD